MNKFMENNFYNRKSNIIGFTLLEMLVVLGIFSLILGVATVSYSTAQKKARDSTRKADLRAIQNALEQYYSVCNFQYPTPLSGGYFAEISCPSAQAVLLPKVPVDPKTLSPYPCNNCGSSNYEICATLESEIPANFCIRNQQ